MPHLTGEPLSYHLYTGDGVETDFTFAKGYLAQSHVHVTVDEVAQVQGSAYTWLDEETIRFSVAPEEGALVLVARHTPIESILGATDGSVMDAKTLQRWYDQNLYWHQEQQDQLDKTLRIGVEANSVEIVLTDQLVHLVHASDTPLALLQTRGTLRLVLSITESGKLSGQLLLASSAPTTVIEGEECPAA